MKPLVRWAGSKRATVHHLREYWRPSNTRYVEPFAGSACLYFELLPKRAILADLNDELINAYRLLKRDPIRVIESYCRFPRGKDAYYRIRATQATELTEAERAARFFYLNRYCFNGLYRTNKKGAFNVPYGPPKSNIDDYANRMLEASSALQAADLIACDFESILEEVVPGDFVYLDPPYVVGNRRVFSEYLPGSFAERDLERLNVSLMQLHARGVDFVVSYADCREARDLLAPWSPRRIWTRRNIAGFAGARRGTYELLATNIRSDRQ